MIRRWLHVVKFEFTTESPRWKNGDFKFTTNCQNCRSFTMVTRRWFAQRSAKSITEWRLCLHGDYTVVFTGTQSLHGVYVSTVKKQQFLAVNVRWIQIHRRIAVVITWQCFLLRCLGGVFCGNCTAIFLRWLDGGFLRWLYGKFNFTTEPPRRLHGNTEIAVFSPRHFGGR